MTNAERLERLERLQDALSELHNQRAVAWQGWHIAKYRAIESGLSNGMNITTAREMADAACVELKNNLVRLEGEIAGHQEERDHHRFVIEHEAI